MDTILYDTQRQGRISFYMTSFGEEVRGFRFLVLWFYNGGYPLHLPTAGPVPLLHTDPFAPRLQGMPLAAAALGSGCWWSTRATSVPCPALRSPCSHHTLPTGVPSPRCPSTLITTAFSPAPPPRAAILQGHAHRIGRGHDARRHCVRAVPRGRRPAAPWLHDEADDGPVLRYVIFGRVGTILAVLGYFCAYMSTRKCLGFS